MLAVSLVLALALASGAIDTHWWDGNHEKMRMLAGRVALNRVSAPDDIAKSVLMLLASGSITGQVIKADNGQTL